MTVNQGGLVRGQENELDYQPLYRLKTENGFLFALASNLNPVAFEAAWIFFRKYQIMFEMFVTAPVSIKIANFKFLLLHNSAHFQKKYPFHRQTDQSDCGPSCLKMVGMQYGKTLNINDLRNKCKRTKAGVTFQALADAAEEVGFKTFGSQIDFETLKNEVPYPCIVQWKQRHLIVVNNVEKNKVTVSDPVFGTIVYDTESFIKGWVDKKNKGAVLLLEPTPEFFEYNEINVGPKTGFNFLFRYFRQFKQYTNQIFIGLIVSSLIQLIFPFLTQAVVDYGINNHDLSFIFLLLIGQLILFFSQTGIEVIRNWLLLHLSNKINISILSNYLKKLMSMPISYFDSKLPGDLYRRVEDNTRIEAFISSTSFNSIFSLLNFVIFSIVLVIYDSTIFLIFLTGAILYIFWILSFLKKRKTMDISS